VPQEQKLGDERPPSLFEGAEEDWEQQPLPGGPITVGIDGGHVRAAHKPGWLEVIAGKSVVAFRREEEGEVPSAKCFGFVQTYDEKPRRRLWELLKSQGMQENQQVVFRSDGGEDVRRVQEYLQPHSEHLIDWFHITMRVAVLQQRSAGREIHSCRIRFQLLPLPRCPRFRRHAPSSVRDSSVINPPSMMKSAI
jgi:hypothetical protein